MIHHGNEILVVDDEPDILQLVKLTLERRGYGVTTACNGRQAMEWLHEKCFDLVITDMVMPGMNGFGLISRLRQTHPWTPVIAISGGMKIFDDEQTGVNSRECADAFLVKPFHSAQLLETVEKLLPEKE